FRFRTLHSSMNRKHYNTMMHMCTQDSISLACLSHPMTRAHYNSYLNLWSKQHISYT
uniref:Uncharacterized protein n=1 Tax=Aegilops tauschii subsp. strangulata TaxID=200361 RepID=A0A453AE55_AEGTS